MNKESAITPWLFKAAQIYTKTFGKIPPVLVDIEIHKEVVDLKIFSLKNNKFLLRWSLFTSSFFICTFILILVSLLRTLTYHSLSTFQVVLLIFYLTYIFLFLITLSIFRKSGYLVHQTNLFIQRGLRFGVRIHKPKHDFVGFLMNYLILILTSFGPPVPILMAYLKIDPFFIITQAFRNHDSLQIYCGISCYTEGFIYLCLTTLFFLIIEKIMFVYLYTLCIIITHIRNYCNTLNAIQHCLSHNSLLKFYFRLLVFIRTTDQFTSDLMLYFIIFGQSLLLLFAWMMVHCRNIFPVFVLAACANAFVGGVLLSNFILKVAAYVQSYSSELVDRKRAQFVGTNRKKNRRYYFTAKWRAYKKARISYASCFVITKDTINVYMEVLTNNITNAVLLVVP